MAAHNLFDWIHINSGQTGGIMKRTKNYLNGLGYTGNTNKMLKNWLTITRGYTGSMMKKYRSFENANTDR